MIVDTKPRRNQLNARRNLSGIYFFILYFYVYYFFARCFYTYNFFNLLKSTIVAARRRNRRFAARPAGGEMGMTDTITWRLAAPLSA
jgi:hypothetical protein